MDLLQEFLQLSLLKQVRCSIVYQAVWIWGAFANEQGYAQDRTADYQEAVVALVLAMKLRESRICELGEFATSDKHYRRLEQLERSMFDAALLANATCTQYDRLNQSSPALDYCAELALFEPTLRCQALSGEALSLAAHCLQGRSATASSQDAKAQALELLSCVGKTPTSLAHKYGIGMAEFEKARELGKNI